LNTRNALISRALQQRYAQVRKKVEALDPRDFDRVHHLEHFVVRARERVIDHAAGRKYDEWKLPRAWFDDEVESLVSLRQLVTEEPFTFKESAPPSDTNFPQRIREASRDPSERFRLLEARYSHVLNFCAPSENLIREHVLERLMVQDRALIERDSWRGMNMDDLLLRLNLIGIYSSTSTDLRFLDALNYYFALFSSVSNPKSRHDWLFVSFLALYARALSIHIQVKET